MEVVNARHILWKTNANSKKLGGRTAPENHSPSIGEQTANMKSRAEKVVRLKKTNATPTSHRRRIVRGSLVLPSRR
jgi:hypothetical protein